MIDRVWPGCQAPNHSFLCPVGGRVLQVDEILQAVDVAEGSCAHEVSAVFGLARGILRSGWLYLQIDFLEGESVSSCFARETNACPCSVRSSLECLLMTSPPSGRKTTSLRCESLLIFFPGTSIEAYKARVPPVIRCLCLVPIARLHQRLVRA